MNWVSLKPYGILYIFALCEILILLDTTCMRGEHSTTQNTVHACAECIKDHTNKCSMCTVQRELNTTQNTISNEWTIGIKHSRCGVISARDTCIHGMDILYKVHVCPHGIYAYTEKLISAWDTCVHRVSLHYLRTGYTYLYTINGFISAKDTCIHGMNIWPHGIYKYINGTN